MKKLALVGGGHAHLYILKQLLLEPLPNVEITLISPRAYQYYSGMFSGYAEGIYEHDDISVNLQQFADRAGITWVEETVTAVFPDKQQLQTSSGKLIAFDAISFDIGSLTQGNDIQGVSQFAHQIKPNFHYPQIIENARAARQLVIVGGGASGVELALSIAAWRAQHKLETPVTLISATQLLPELTAKASKKIEKIVLQQQIQLLKNCRVTKVEQNELRLSDGRTVPYDKLLWLTGPRAHPMFKDANLRVDQEGFLLVNKTLQALDYPWMFGAGDCATMVDYPNLPKIGVYAVRQGPILYQNIKAYLTNQSLVSYEPQKRYLSILSIGNKRGFLVYNKKFSYTGRLAWLLKHKIDNTFMKKFH